LNDINKMNDVKLILQPNNAYEWLRNKLKENNFKIVDEDVVKENDIYSVIIVCEKGESNVCDETDVIIGPILKNKHDKNVYNFIQHTYDKINLFIDDTPDDKKNKLKRDQKIREEYLNVNK
jgi:tRNA (adenine22-N1)-methyltransferase